MMISCEEKSDEKNGNLFSRQSVGWDLNLNLNLIHHWHRHHGCFDIHIDYHGNMHGLSLQIEPWDSRASLLATGFFVDVRKLFAMTVTENGALQQTSN